MQGLKKGNPKVFGGQVISGVLLGSPFFESRCIYEFFLPSFCNWTAAALTSAVRQRLSQERGCLQAADLPSGCFVDVPPPPHFFAWVFFVMDSEDPSCVGARKFCLWSPFRIWGTTTQRKDAAACEIATNFRPGLLSLAQSRVSESMGSRLQGTPTTPTSHPRISHPKTAEPQPHPVEETSFRIPRRWHGAGSRRPEPVAVSARHHLRALAMDAGIFERCDHNIQLADGRWAEQSNHRRLLRRGSKEETSTRRETTDPAELESRVQTQAKAETKTIHRSEKEEKRPKKRKWSRGRPKKGSRKNSKKHKKEGDTILRTHLC